MMLAMRLERNVLQQDEFVIAADFLKSPRQMIAGIFEIAFAIFTPRPPDARRRIAQPLAVGIITGPAQYRAHGVLHLLRHSEFLFFGRRFDGVMMISHEAGVYLLFPVATENCQRMWTLAGCRYGKGDWCSAQ